MLTFIITLLQARLRDERGATAVEYGLLVVSIALIMAVGAAILGGELSTLFSNVL